MKYILVFLFSFLISSCTNNKTVYWCGDHACINDAEKEKYFKKTMVVEVKKITDENIKTKSELEIIREQANLDDKKKKFAKKTLSKRKNLKRINISISNKRFINLY